MPGRWSIPAVVTALGLAVRAGAAPPCPGALAQVTVFVRNLSADAAVSLTIAGELADPAATCTGSGDATYQRVLSCAGAGLVECGVISGLRPGTWVNHVSATVTGSGPQAQHQPAVFIGGWGSNALLWTIYPRTVVVAEASEPALRDALAAATPGTLVTFPPAASRQTIHLAGGPCPPGHQAALCFTGSGIVVDAVDAHGAPGVELSVDALPISILHVFGSDDVFRGLVLDGSQTPTPTVQSDTVAFTGADARRNRLEQSVVHGPTRGDAVSADHAAGGQGGDDANVVDGCEVRDARDKGVKVTTGAHVLVRRTCLHDNANGGVQATLGGHVVALENLIQHNVPGAAQNGIMVRGLSACLDDPLANCDEPSTGVTSGNVVRFHGGRGLTATDNALASFADDYVADNQIIGSRVETTLQDPATAAQPGGAVPDATFRGVAFICNRNAGLSGTCQPQASDAATSCGTDADCCGLPDGCCVNDAGCASPLMCEPPAVDGFGVTVAQATGKPVPHVDYGTAVDAGQNAFALNQSTAAGTNFKVNVAGLAVDAQGNQWEHCGTTMSCSTTAVHAMDIVVASGASVSLGDPPGPRAGIPVLDRVSPARPRKGELVRVFGQNFNAIEGTACGTAPAGLDWCSGENSAVEDQNRTSNANGLAIVAARDVVLATVWPDAVTPTMLAFRMPFDCFGPLTLRVTKRADDAGTIVSTTTPLCDPGGCTDRDAGEPCEDGNACTVGDRCDGSGRCLHGVARVCAGACLLGSCDPDVGCVPLPVDAPCDDGDVCTTGDHCSGTGDSCVPGSTDCDDGDPCTTGDVCAAGVCQGVPLDGFPGSICAMAESLVPAICGADRGAGALEERARRRLATAEHLLRRAESVGSTRKRNRLVRRSAAALQEVARLAARWRNGGKLSRGCAGAVREAVAERRRLVLGLIV